MTDPSTIMTVDRLADTIRTVQGAMRGASTLQLAALDRLLAHVRATEALAASRRPSAMVPLDTAERAREKQASRDKDASDVTSGAKTREQLHAENAAFAGLTVRVKR